MQKKTLYINQLNPYDAVKLNCSTRWNLGALEHPYLGGGHNGTLNAKQDLIDLIQQAGGNFIAEPGFVYATRGMLRRSVGTGYVGWKDFGSHQGAITYLEKYFHLSYCKSCGSTPTSTSVPESPVKAADKDCHTGCCSTITAGTPGVIYGCSRSDLERLGFQNVGQRTSQGPKRLKDVGDDQEYWDELIKQVRALYAFCSGEEVLYIGKTARSITKRFVGYRAPGKKQTTNIKCHREIQRLIKLKETIRILVFPDIAKLQWDDFKINLAAGLEDALVAHFKPRLNGTGSHFVTTTAEDELYAEKNAN